MLSVRTVTATTDPVPDAMCVLAGCEVVTLIHCLQYQRGWHPAPADKRQRALSAHGLPSPAAGVAGEGHARSGRGQPQLAGRLVSLQDLFQTVHFFLYRCQISLQLLVFSFRSLKFLKEMNYLLKICQCTNVNLKKLPVAHTCQLAPMRTFSRNFPQTERKACMLFLSIKFDKITVSTFFVTFAVLFCFLCIRIQWVSLWAQNKNSTCEAL